jgi:AcrR family transcriptional regulator
MESGEVKRLRILESARAVFSEQGFEAAKMDEVARRARVSKGTVYNHFESKESLLIECVRLSMTRNRERVESLVRASDDPGLVTALRALLLDLLPEVGESQALHYQIWSLVARDPAARERLFSFFRDFYRHNERLVLQGLADGVERGEVRRDMVTGGAAALLLAVFDGLIYRAMFDAEQVDAEQVLETLLRLLADPGEGACEG